MTARDGNESPDVVEMDAIDIEEWDRDRHTPRAHDTNLAELVRQSTAAERVRPEPAIKSLKTATAHTTRSQRTPSTTLPTPTPIQQTLVQTSKDNPKVDDAWDESFKPPATTPPPSPRTKTSPNTLRRTEAATPVAKPSDPPKRATQADSPVAAKPIAPKPAPKPTTPQPTPPQATKPTAPPKPAEPPMRPSEPAILPPPPPAPASAIAPAEDWDDSSAKTAAPAPVKRADPSDFDASREPSVVIDLNAVPKPATGAKRHQTSPVIQTSAQSTTTSGAFVMPTASPPISESPPVVTPPNSVWDRPSVPAPAAVARQTPTPSALEAAVPQPIVHVDATEDRIVPRSILATVFPTPRTRRTAVIACAGVAVLVIVLVVAIGGHHATEAPPAIATKSTPRVVAPPPAKPAPVVHVAAVATPAPPPPIEAPVPPPRKAPARPIVQRKPVVVDYDKKPAAPTAADRDQSLVRARAAYATGNQHLFAGDATAAIASYHQALAVYPNYVAGYRGLGLAYSQQGDTAAALKAFKTYVRLAPAAKDAALITKRIARLSAR